MNYKSILNSFIKYVTINCLGSIGLSCYILADTFFVSLALGTTGLAALNLSISVFSIIQGLGLLLGIGGATRFAIKASKKETNDALTLTLLLWAVTSLLFILIAVFCPEAIARLLGADENTLPLTTTYLTTLLYFSPFFLLNNIMLAFIRNDNNPGLSMLAMIISSLSNIVLDYVFMFPFNMGIFGAALATCLSPLISLSILSLHVIRQKHSFSVQRYQISLSAFRNIAALGFSSMIGELASATTLIVFNLAIYRITGNTGVAAYSIVANIALIVTALFTGVSQGTQPLASKAYGAGKAEDISQIKKYVFVTSFLLAFITYSIIILFSTSIISIFNSEGNETLLQLAHNGSIVYFIGYFFAGANIVMAAFLSAVGNTKGAFIISSLRSMVLIIPLALLLGRIFKMNGIWFSFVITESLVFLITLYYYRNYPFLHKQVP